jgi:hypothetical protein
MAARKTRAATTQRESNTDDDELQDRLTPEEPQSSAQEGREEYLQTLRAQAAHRKREQEIQELEAFLRGASVTTANAPLALRPIKLKDLSEYKGKSVKEARDWFAEAENAFSLDPASFPSEERKIRWSIQFLGHNTRSLWNSQIAMKRLEDHTWEEFKEFLLNALEHPANRMANAYTRWNQTNQKEGQSVAEFHNYLQSIEQQIEEQSPIALAMNFFAKLRGELRDQILRSGQDLPTTREAMITLASRMEPKPKRTATSPPKTFAPNKRNRPEDQKAENAENKLPVRNRNATYAQRTTCYRCGRTNHKIQDCFATSHINGTPLQTYNQNPNMIPPGKG